MIITEDIKSLFKYVRTKLGAPIRPIQLDDNQLCDLLDGCIGYYAEKVQNWIIQYNWLNLMGKGNFLTDPHELAFALTT